MFEGAEDTGKKYGESLRKYAGRLRTEAEIEELEQREIEGAEEAKGTHGHEEQQEEELQSPGRRLLLKGAAALGGAAMFGVPERRLSESQDQVFRNAEGEPVSFTPDVQLAK